MSPHEFRERAHDLDVTLRVGKRGVDAVVDEAEDQLADRDLLKVKFLRASRAGDDVEDLATGLADAVGADVVETRGHTAVLHR